MKNQKQTYSFEQVYNKRTDPLRTQGCVSLLNKSVRTALMEKKDFLNNDELADKLSSIAAAQDVPTALCSMLAKIYKVYAECN